MIYLAFIAGFATCAVFAASWAWYAMDEHA